MTALAVAAAGILVVAAPLCHASIPGVLTERRRLSVEDAEQHSPLSSGKRVLVTVDVPGDLNGVAADMPGTREGWAFYGRHKRRPEWILIEPSGDGCLVAASEERRTVLDLARCPLPPAPRISWRFYRRGMTVDVGGVCLFETDDRSDWRFWWVDTPEPPRPYKLYRLEAEDGFMRTAFGKTDRWTVAGGDWRLKQYGGGMPTNEAEARSASFRRASNPFTLVGKDGFVHLGRGDWVNYYAEARYFFGKPFSYAERDTLERTVLGGEPIYRDKEAIYNSDQIFEYPEGDFFVVQGIPPHAQAAFGWSARESRFELRVRLPASSQWEVLRHWDWRPHFTNWVRIGLGNVHGCRLMPFIDGEQLGTYESGLVISGPMGLLSSAGLAECDDIRVHSYPRQAELGTPVFEESTLFAQKELLPKKDVQTGQWTRSELSFDDEEGRIRGRGLTVRRCLFPFYGDFTYQPSVTLPDGPYCLAFLNDTGRTYFRAFLEKEGSTWELEDGARTHDLLIGRRAGRLVVRTDEGWKLLAQRRLSATVYLAVGGTDEAALDPGKHMIYSSCLTHELFEKAPSDWAWREGNFRMDVRWQCQRGWNFMMGKSRDLAVMYSKSAYEGDQEIEFHIALRFVTPPPYYVPRDMGFAFCTDGKNLSSGYVLIYGDQDNTETTLLKNGEPVEQVDCIIKHKPGGNIHNYWWHGRVCMQGRMITVEIDDRLVIRFRDRSPLDGGHVAFWTRRNAISLAKVSINAERQARKPQLFTVDASPIPNGRWRPLNPDEVDVRERGGEWRVTNRFGGGTFGVRCVLPGAGVRIESRDRLRVPLRLDRDTCIGVHLQISGRSFYCPLTSSSRDVRGLLTPEWEKRPSDRVFRAQALSPEELETMTLSSRMSGGDLVVAIDEARRDLGDEARLESITLGNASNDGYLLLGAGGNPAGASFVVGTPEVR